MPDTHAVLAEWIAENADAGILLAVLGVIVLAMTKGVRRRKGPGGDVGGIHLGGADRTGGGCSSHTGGHVSGESGGDGGGGDAGGE